MELKLQDYTDIYYSLGLETITRKNDLLEAELGVKFLSPEEIKRTEDRIKRLGLLMEKLRNISKQFTN